MYRTPRLDFASAENFAGSSTSSTLSLGSDLSTDLTRLASYLPTPPTSHPPESLFGKGRRASKRTALKQPSEREKQARADGGLTLAQGDDFDPGKSDLGLDAATVQSLGTSVWSVVELSSAAPLQTPLKESFLFVIPRFDLSLLKFSTDIYKCLDPT